ncbi:MAG: AraC family transcriptional regulator [Bacteroidaceae bacterium]|nr:AraC family transcriptional regulator [Bacteroidaceae bacterium]
MNSTNNPINPLHFFMLPERSDGVLYEGGLAVYGTLTGKENVIDDDKPFSQYLQKPMRLMMGLIFICRSGRLTVRCNLQEHIVQAGEALILLPGTTIESLQVARSTQACLIAGTKDIASDMRLIQTSFIDSVDFVRPVRLCITPEQLDFFAQWIELVRSCATMPVGEERREAVSACARILSCQLRLCSSPEVRKGKERSPRRNEIYAQFIRDVLQFFRTERNLTFYADRQFITPKYLGASVTQASGRRAYDIICDQVILEAKMLLRQPGITVQQVSYQLNFPNHSFFSKFFKAHTQLTPQQFIAGE